MSTKRPTAFDGGSFVMPLSSIQMMSPMAQWTWMPPLKPMGQRVEYLRAMLPSPANVRTSAGSQSANPSFRLA